MSRIEKNADWLDKVASASSLYLNDEELWHLAIEVGAELSCLSEEPLEGITERWQDGAVTIESLREDCPGECLNREKLLAPSSYHNDTCFLVPRVLGSEGDKA